MKLEDIDIIGAIGDSDTAAFAANSRGGLDYFTEFWGVSFVTGMDGSWADNPSLANLLRACNPGLEGKRRQQPFKNLFDKAATATSTGKRLAVV